MLKVLVFDNCEHHSGAADYSNLVSHLQSAAWLSEKDFLEGKITWKANNSGSRLPDNFSELTEFTRLNNSVFHILRGDYTQAMHLLKLLCPKSPVIMTSHQPLEIIPHENIEIMKTADFITSVSKTQIQPLFNAGIHRVRHIPLGVASRKIFETENAEQEIIMAGEHLRDWQCLNYVFMKLRDNFNLPCRIIAPRFHNNLPIIRNIPISLALSDQEYFNCLSSSLVVFSPLTSATANNVLLEAMTLGSAIVCSDLPATREYLGDAALYFINEDPDQAVSAIRSLTLDKELRNSYCQAARSRSKLYDWNVISKKYEELYLETANFSSI